MKNLWMLTISAAIYLKNLGNFCQFITASQGRTQLRIHLELGKLNHFKKLWKRIRLVFSSVSRTIFSDYHVSWKRQQISCWDKISNVWETETKIELQFNLRTINSTWMSQDSQTTNNNLGPMLRTKYCVLRSYWPWLGEGRCAKATIIHKISETNSSFHVK